MKIKEFPNLEILDITYSNNCGFVIAKDVITNKVQAYFGIIFEKDEQMDITYILGLGAKLPIEYFYKFKNEEN